MEQATEEKIVVDGALDLTKEASSNTHNQSVTAASDVNEQTTMTPAMNSQQQLVHASIQTQHTGVQISYFTLFSTLPVELRLKIWKEAHSNPRIVPISSLDIYRGEQDKVRRQFNAANSTLSARFARRDSFEVFRAAYSQLIVSIVNNNSISSEIFSKALYFHPNIDTLCVNLIPTEDGTFPELQGLSGVRNLAIRTYLPVSASFLRDFYNLIGLAKAKFPVLKNLSLVGREIHPSEYDVHWQFIPLDCPKTNLETWLDHRLVDEDPGTIRQFSVDRDECLRMFRDYVRKRPEWADVTFEVGLLSKKF